MRVTSTSRLGGGSCVSTSGKRGWPGPFFFSFFSFQLTSFLLGNLGYSGGPERTSEWEEMAPRQKISLSGCMKHGKGKTRADVVVVFLVLVVAAGPEMAWRVLQQESGASDGLWGAVGG